MFCYEKSNNKPKEAQKGITLIALVITIIVLLILAGVSIAMLTGQNGILTQAQNAKTTTENKSAEEKVKLSVMGARADDGTLTVGKLRTELANYGGTVEGEVFPVTAKVDGKKFYGRCKWKCSISRKFNRTKSTSINRKWNIRKSNRK